MFDNRPLTRPNNLKDLDLDLTGDQSRLLKAMLDDLRGTKDPVEGLLKQKYWFLRIWEAGEKDGNIDKEIVNQWRSKKKEILQRKGESNG